MKGTSKQQLKFWVAGVLLGIVSFGAAFMYKDQTGIRVTFHIFSGRQSPYFDGATVGEIEARLKDLPVVENPKEAHLWSGIYLFDLPGGVDVEVRDTEIALRTGNKTVTYRDSRGLRQYLDSARKSKLVYPDGGQRVEEYD